MNKSAEEVKRQISSRGVVIIGAGMIAKRFYRALELNKIEDKVAYFAVSSISENRSLFSKDIKSINKIAVDDNNLICIAVHETSYYELIYELEKYGIDEYIWIVPILNELIFGSVIYNGELSVNELLHKHKSDNYSFAIRNLAIASYYEGNSYGWNLYRKYMRFYFSEDSAKKREKAFMGLISSWDTIGYDNASIIPVDSQHRILDGSHRLSLAIYHRIDKLNCAVYATSKGYDLFENVFPDLQALQNAGFSDHEIDSVIKTQEEIWNR